ncbi:MAG: methyl-accepting chemotaxis protein [Bacteroidota bacterium]|nr:methyl-accepting chemotaxis protein [Bacteroidota bacterium]
MKFKNLKLSGKLAIGFGLLIVISIVISGIAIVNFNTIGAESEVLANEYVPEVKVATDLRGGANRVMYEMRGYGFTEEKEFYNNAQEEIVAIRKAISHGKDVSNNTTRLVKLAGELKTVEDATDKYVKLTEQTVKLNEGLKEDRATMDKNAGLYISNCNIYLAGQNKSMLNEINAGQTNEERLKKITFINNIIDITNAVRVENFKSQAKRDPKIFENALAKFPEVYSLLAQIRTYTKRKSNLNLLDNIEDAAINYENAMKDFIKDWKKREELGDQRSKAGKTLIASCIVIADAGLTGTQEIADESVVLVKTSSRIMLIGSLTALLIGILLAVIITKIISVPIIKGVDFATQISKGNLNATIDVDQKDETGQLVKSLQNMAGRLKEIITSVASSSIYIADSSEQLSSSSQQMAQSSNEQAASTEEVSATMEQMQANIQQNTDNATETEKISSKAASDIEQGGKAVMETVKAMKNIAEKISIISEIAFQTNILALNAAVEAARAGEEGEGFAVVAEEVRSLAERSRDAAEEIDKISANSVSVAENSGNMLSAIVPDIKKTSILVKEIANASIEQNSSVAQVTSSVEQLNKVSQRTSAISEEEASSAEELSTQADQLKQAISFFKIKELEITQNLNIKHNNNTAQEYSQTQKYETGSNIDLDLDDESDSDFKKY